VICSAGPGDAGVEDVTGEAVNARTRVHEYGGGSYAVGGDALFFSNYADQRLHRQDPGSAVPRPITPEPPAAAAHRYADACPTPDGRRLARLEWDHPNMPWDATELRLGELAGGALAGDPVTVAGGPAESVVQPEWSPGGVLHLVSDRTGWWNLYRVGARGTLEALAPAEEEFGAAHWAFGMSTYAFLPGGRIACIHGRGPMQRLGVLDLDAGGSGGPRGVPRCIP
jgi:hypothetical protein